MGHSRRTLNSVFIYAAGNKYKYNWEWKKYLRTFFDVEGKKGRIKMWEY